MEMKDEIDLEINLDAIAEELFLLLMFACLVLFSAIMFTLTGILAVMLTLLLFSPHSMEDMEDMSGKS